MISNIDIAKFWSRVEVRKEDQCWPWRYGTTNDGGYGEFFLGDRTKDMAHRVSYRIGKGEIPEGMIVRHQCDNPICCNWHHLIVGSNLDNVRDRVERDRSARGTDNGRAKLCDEDIQHIRDSPLGITCLAKSYGVDRGTIRAIRNGRTWTHVPNPG